MACAANVALVSPLNVAAVLATEALFVDLEPPSSGTLLSCKDGSHYPCSTTVAQTCSSGCVYLTWSGVFDALSPLTLIDLVISASSDNVTFATIYEAGQPFVTASKKVDCSHTLAPGTIVRSQLIVRDAAGNVNTSTSIIVVDSSPPGIPTANASVVNGNTTHVHVREHRAALVPSEFSHPVVQVAVRCCTTCGWCP